jgi:hypothetical protein
VNNKGMICDLVLLLNDGANAGRRYARLRDDACACPGGSQSRKFGTEDPQFVDPLFNDPDLLVDEVKDLTTG